MPQFTVLAVTEGAVETNTTPLDIDLFHQQLVIPNPASAGEESALLDSSETLALQDESRFLPLVGMTNLRRNATQTTARRSQVFRSQRTIHAEPLYDATAICGALPRSARKRSMAAMLPTLSNSGSSFT